MPDILRSDLAGGGSMRRSSGPKNTRGRGVACCLAQPRWPPRAAAVALVLTSAHPVAGDRRRSAACGREGRAAAPAPIPRDDQYYYVQSRARCAFDVRGRGPAP